MKCGEFDKRNDEYHKEFSVENYFSRLLVGDEFNSSGSEEIIIFDVGAHKGESAEFFHQVFNNAHIYSFEPNPDAANTIKLKDIPNVKVFTLALSNESGKFRFNVQDLSHLSSLNPINTRSEHSLGYAEKETHTEIDVMVARGDEFCASNGVAKIDLLKVDVQANEVDTLAGFSNFISNVRVVFVEVSLYDFYKKKSSIRQIEEVLIGFELYDIYEISKNPKTLGTDWATLVYKNKKLKNY